MNRFFVILLVVLTMSGCGAYGTMTVPSTDPRSVPPGTKPVIFLQRGVNLQVFNNCSTTPAKLYPSHPVTGQAEVLVPAGPPTWVPMAPNFLEVENRVAATVHFFEGSLMVGTVSRSFPIDRDATQRIQWVLGGERGSGGRNVYIDRCPRAFDRR